jgi:hypothetical protein
MKNETFVVDDNDFLFVIFILIMHEILCQTWKSVVLQTLNNYIKQINTVSACAENQKPFDGQTYMV